MDTKEVIRAGGGASHLGRALGLHHSTILKWKRIPAEHVPELSRITGIPRHKIRPDLWEPPATAAEKLVPAEIGREAA